MPCTYMYEYFLETMQFVLKLSNNSHRIERSILFSSQRNGVRSEHGDFYWYLKSVQETSPWKQSVLCVVVTNDNNFYVLDISHFRGVIKWINVMQ